MTSGFPRTDKTSQKYLNSRTLAQNTPPFKVSHDAIRVRNPILVGHRKQNTKVKETLNVILSGMESNILVKG